MKIVKKKKPFYLIGKVFADKNSGLNRKIVGYAIRGNINDVILICESDEPTLGISSYDIHSLMAYCRCEIKEFQSDESVKKWYSLIWGIQELNNHYIEIKDEDTTQNR